jgi:hypothetical protein
MKTLPERASVQFEWDREARKALPAGTIAWYEHQLAWEGYRKKYPSSAAQQDALRIHERGGFGHVELLEFLGHPARTFQAL